MNCKQGDLAIVIQSYNPAWIGMCVTCVEFVGSFNGFPGNDYWLLDGKHELFKESDNVYIRDIGLMPISGYKPEVELGKCLVKTD